MQALIDTVVHTSAIISMDARTTPSGSGCPKPSLPSLFENRAGHSQISFLFDIHHLRPIVLLVISSVKLFALVQRLGEGGPCS
jgi:hypothetical protein